MSESAAPEREEALLQTPPIEPNAALSGRVVQLDGLRALAIGLVLINHTLHTPLTWVGVDIFFVLSGFLITGILLERKRLRGPYFSYFYRRRVFRILPPYVLTIVLYGLIFGWGSFRPFWLFLLAPNVHAVKYGGPNLAMWSLAVEEQFYFIWPFVVLFTSERVLMRVAIAALALTPLLRMVCTPLFPTHFYIYAYTPFRADLLCAGAVLALWWKRRNSVISARLRRWSPVVCLLGFFLFAATQAFPVLRLAHNTPWANGFVYLFSLIGSAGLLAWTLTDTGWLRSVLSTAPMRYLGEISYTMYLVHLPILIWLQVRYGVGARMQLLGTFLIVTYASISWFAMERPLLRFAAGRTFPKSRLATSN